VSAFRFTSPVLAQYYVSSSCGQKYHVPSGDLILRVLDCIVNISFGCILYCGCFNLFCKVWACVCVGCFDNCEGALLI